MKGHGGTCECMRSGAPMSAGARQDVRRVPRLTLRGFFMLFQREGPAEEEDIIWTVPPVYPFETREPDENSGFVARLRHSN